VHQLRRKSPDGEIGRRSGLKIRRPQGRGGSSPPLGTNKNKGFTVNKATDMVSFMLFSALSVLFSIDRHYPHPIEQLDIAIHTGIRKSEQFGKPPQKEQTLLWGRPG
jgi:hypothetical protein